MTVQPSRTEDGSTNPTPPQWIVDLTPNTRVDLTITVTADGQVSVQQRTAPLNAPPTRRVRLYRWLKQQLTPATMLFLLTLLVYLFTRFNHLPDYPIYFYSDEAINTVRAADLVRDQFRDQFGTLLPTYFINDAKFSLGTTVYLQIPPYLLFGKSVWATRSVVVLLGLLGLLWVWLILRDIFQLRYAWLGPMLLCAAPVWFLFTRVAVETPMMTAFYAGFLYYYLLYRLRSPRYLYAALLLGALVFYTYAAGQMIIVFSGLLLLALDWRYHWQQRRTAALGLALLILLALPWLRFSLQYPQEYVNRLAQYGSYLQSDLTAPQKIGRFWREYFGALNPAYWFLLRRKDPIWWTMGSYAHFSPLLLPFWLYGLWMALRAWRDPRMRTLAAAYLAGPVGAATVSVEITRVLVLVLPITLTLCLGAEAVLKRLERRIQPVWIHYLLFVVLTASSLTLLQDALRNGPTWSRDYDMDGMQWGARQMYGRALEYSAAYPDQMINVSGDWTWQADIMTRFFIPDGSNVVVRNPMPFMRREYADLGKNIFVVTPRELEATNQSGRFNPPQVLQTLPCPDSSPCFYFIRLSYRADLAAQLAADREQRHRLVDEPISLLGMNVKTRHTYLPEGIAALFDGNTSAPVRTGLANPMVIELDFPTPVMLSGVDIQFGSAPMQVRGQWIGESGTPPGEILMDFQPDGDQILHIPFPAPGVPVRHLQLEMTLTDREEDAIVHVWEIWLRQ